MYEFVDENIREHGEGNEVLINTGKPFAVKNPLLAKSLVSRGILKFLGELAKEVVENVAENAIDKVTEKVTKQK